MDNRCFDRILGHNIDDNVKVLIEEVTSYFPHKELLVHPLSLAERELGETYSYNINGISKPSLTDYIGIWINENHTNSEFNIILAEELCHHRQAYYEYRTIFGYSHSEYIRTFGNLLYNSILDIDAHFFLFKRGFDLTPILNLDYLDAIDSIKTFTKEQQSLYSQHNLYFMLFPQYLLWWFDLVHLHSGLKYKWETEINSWFSSILPPETIALWAKLLRFIANRPLHSSRSVETLMTRISRELVEIMPVFTAMETTGLHIDLIMKELVPIERTARAPLLQTKVLRKLSHPRDNLRARPTLLILSIIILPYSDKQTQMAQRPP